MALCFPFFIYIYGSGCAAAAACIECRRVVRGLLIQSQRVQPCCANIRPVLLYVHCALLLMSCFRAYRITLKATLPRPLSSPPRHIIDMHDVAVPETSGASSYKENIIRHGTEIANSSGEPFERVSSSPEGGEMTTTTAADVPSRAPDDSLTTRGKSHLPRHDSRSQLPSLPLAIWLLLLHEPMVMEACARQQRLSSRVSRARASSSAIDLTERSGGGASLVVVLMRTMASQQLSAPPCSLSLALLLFRWYAHHLPYLLSALLPNHAHTKQNVRK